IVVMYATSTLSILIAAVLGTAWALAMAMVVAGFAMALGNPLTNRLIATNVAAPHRGLFTGIKQAGVPSVLFLAGLALPALALYIGWRGALLASLLVVAAGGVLAARYLSQRSVANTVPVRSTSAP